MFSAPIQRLHIQLAGIAKLIGRHKNALTQNWARAQNTSISPPIPVGEGLVPSRVIETNKVLGYPGRHKTGPYTMVAGIAPGDGNLYAFAATMLTSSWMVSSMLMTGPTIGFCMLY